MGEGSHGFKSSRDTLSSDAYVRNLFLKAIDIFISCPLLIDFDRTDQLKHFFDNSKPPTTFLPYKTTMRQNTMILVQVK